MSPEQSTVDQSASVPKSLRISLQPLTTCGRCSMPEVPPEDDEAMEVSISLKSYACRSSRLKA